MQDVQGKLLEIGGGLASRSEHALRTGYDAEVIDRENARDNARAERLNLHYTTDTGQPVRDQGTPVKENAMNSPWRWPPSGRCWA
ncbi:hypothetical protein P4056_23040 [Pseudomonas aeruginosa]|nr:hypothetical protein [Pseudomonas aeruginosa]